MSRALLDADFCSLSYERSPGYRQRLRLNGTNCIQDGKFRAVGSMIEVEVRVRLAAFGNLVGLAMAQTNWSQPQPVATSPQPLHGKPVVHPEDPMSF